MAEVPPALPGPLTGDEIRALLAGERPLVRDVADIAIQLQPHGLDLRLESVWLPRGAGRLGWLERVLPDRRPLAFGGDGWLHLDPGAYVVRFWETVDLPLDVMALAFPRSSLLRAGCALHNAVWDAGYRGRSEALLTVLNPSGLSVERGARIAQMVFFRLPRGTRPYRGVYQGENTGQPGAQPAGEHTVDGSE